MLVIAWAPKPHPITSPSLPLYTEGRNVPFKRVLMSYTTAKILYNTAPQIIQELLDLLEYKFHFWL